MSWWLASKVAEGRWVAVNRLCVLRRWHLFLCIYIHIYIYYNPFTSLSMAVHQVISFEVRPPLELARFKSWSSWVVLQVCYSTIVGYCWVFAESLGWSAVSVWAVYDDVSVVSTAQADPDKNCPTVSAADMADKVCSNWSCLPAECERHSLCTPQSVCYLSVCVAM